ncbi:hypothetical protein Forpe1208_v008342 [Fusarium oxysporum f. sp. rapae]|uniref:WSC domain-containing protein n=1 Tax=Fusarium oxysporum f. sp. rapae TaxID=485398 RepID=A0A8J5NXE3_FUSOX|nr:hypothetical protein Forpe1208_v008342 [Fusarium oxysporum f. sp. rapae]
MRRHPGLLAIWALLLSPCSSIDIVTTNDGNVLANAAISGPGVTVVSGSFSGSSMAAGTFSNGPFGIGSGIILTSGSAAGALPGGDGYVANGAAGSNTYCGANTFDGAILTMDIDVDAGFNGFLVQLILAGQPDPIGIFLDGTQYANDANGQPINADSSYLQSPTNINRPASDTSYDSSSPPLLFGVSASPGAHSLVLAICDFSDRDFDSGLMINIEGCTDCNQPIKINYVTTTTTVGADVATSTTSTIKASGTVSGTFIATVQGEEETTTTTTAEPMTTTTEADNTITTTEADTTTTTTEADTTTTTGEESATTTTTADQSQPPTTTDSDTDTTTTTMHMSTTMTSETDTTGTESSTISPVTESTTTVAPTSSKPSSIDTTTSTATATATEAISRTQESTSTSFEASTLTPTSLQTQSPVVDSTTTSVTMQSVDTPTTATSPDEMGTRTETSSSEETSDTTTSTDQLASTITSIEVSRVSTSPSLTTDRTATQTSLGAENKQRIGQYVYVGCLGSQEGYPSFSEVATDPDMTTDKCVGLASGSNYVGMYQRSCYIADSLFEAELVPDGMCDLLCPGDETLFCGGNIGDRLRRRAVPSDRLLTLYKLSDLSSSSEGTAASLTATTLPSELSSGSVDTSIEGFSTMTDELPSVGTTITSRSLEPTLATETDKPTIAIPTSTEGRLPLPFPTIGPIQTVHWTKGVNYTRIAATSTVTSVAYITVHPSNPAYLITTYVAVTQGFIPCNCDNQVYPPVDMTTIIAPCRACGANGENSVTLTVPTAACEAGKAEPGYSHKISHSAHKIIEHEIYSEVKSFAEPRPTLGQQGHPLPVQGSPESNRKGKPQPSRVDTVSRPVNSIAVVEPPQPLATGGNQVASTPPKTWATEKSAAGQIQKPEATQVSHPASPWDRSSTPTPVVVASATKHHLTPWTVAGLVFSLVFLLV